MDESDTDGAECSRKVASGRRVAGAIRLMLGICSFSVLESCMKRCLCLFLCMAVRQRYGRKKGDLELGLRGLLGIRRMDRVLNAWIRELCKVKKGLDERIDEGILRWFHHVERMGNDRIAKRVYVGECAGSHSVSRPWKRWIDTVKYCLKKRELDVR